MKFRVQWSIWPIRAVPSLKSPKSQKLPNSIRGVAPYEKKPTLQVGFFLPAPGNLCCFGAVTRMEYAC
jgi:hypothetical protein